MRTAALVIAAIVLVAVTAIILSKRLGHPDVGPPPAPASWLQMDDAIVELGRASIAAVEADPSDAQLRAKLAMVYQANGFPHLAVEAYQQALALDDDQPRWWYRMANAQRVLEDRDAAYAALDRAAALDDEYAPLWWRSGTWLIDDGRPDEAEAAFSRCLALEPANVAGKAGLARVYLRRREFDRVVELLPAVVRAGNHPPAEPYLRHLLGTALHRLDRLAEARGELSLATGAAPSWPDPWMSTVFDYRRGYKATMERVDALLGAGAGGIQPAINTLDEHLDAYPDDLIALNKLATAYIMRGTPQRAAETLRRALRIDEDHVPSHINLSLAYENSGNLDSAAVHAARAVEFAPELADAHRQLGRVYALDEAWEPAAASLVQSMRLGAKDPGTGTTCGWVLIQLDRWSDARVVFQEVVTNAPLHCSAWVGLARAQGELGDLEQGMAALRQAASIDSSDPNLQPTLARLQELGAGS